MHAISMDKSTLTLLTLCRHLDNGMAFAIAIADSREIPHLI